MADGDVSLRSPSGGDISLLDSSAAPAIYVNVGGTWKQATGIYVNVSGVWKEVTTLDVNVAGTWKSA